MRQVLAMNGLVEGRRSAQEAITALRDRGEAPSARQTTVNGDGRSNPAASGPATAWAYWLRERCREFLPAV